MPGDAALCEGVRTLLETAAGFLPATGLGVVRPDGPDHVVFTYVDLFGATAYRARPSDLPEPVRPRRADLLRLSATALEANPLGLVESRLMHSWVPHDVRDQFGVRDVVTVPVPGADRPTTVLLGLSEAVPLTATQISRIDSLAARVLDFLGQVESPHDELERLRRLDAVDRLLPAFFRVLDVREIFDRLSAITRDVLRHDFASVGMFYRDLTEIELYVQTAEGPFPRERAPMIFPPAQTSTFLYRIIDDLGAHPLERGWGSLITAEHLSLRTAPRPPSPAPAAPPAPEPAVPVADAALPASADDLQSMERAMVEQALQNARFNKSKAAKALGLTRQQLYVRMRRYGLE